MGESYDLRELAEKLTEAFPQIAALYHAVLIQAFCAVQLQANHAVRTQAYHALPAISHKNTTAYKSRFGLEIRLKIALPAPSSGPGPAPPRSHGA